MRKRSESVCYFKILQITNENIFLKERGSHVDDLHFVSSFIWFLPRINEHSCAPIRKEVCEVDIWKQFNQVHQSNLPTKLFYVIN